MIELLLEHVLSSYSTENSDFRKYAASSFGLISFIQSSVENHSTITSFYNGLKSFGSLNATSYAVMPHFGGEGTNL